jgi:hypothetical protein
MYDSSDVLLCTEGMGVRPLIAPPTTPIKTAAFSEYSRGIPNSDGVEDDAWAEGDKEGMGGDDGALGVRANPQTPPCLSGGQKGNGCAVGYTMLTTIGHHEYRYTE